MRRSISVAGIFCLTLPVLLWAACPITSTVPTDTSRPPVETSVAAPADRATPIPATHTPGPTPSPNLLAELGRMVFLSSRDGNPEIYVMNLDGSQLTRLTQTEAYEQIPSVSPDGHRIAFSANYDDGDDIYTLDLDGSGLTRLTGSSRNYFPEWSSDGEKIVFNSFRDLVPGHEGPPGEIYIMDADGSNQVRLTSNTTSDLCPSLSPDGQQIAFYAYSDDYPSSLIEIMGTDGTNQRPLVDTPEDDGCPAWSPDGTRIAFASTRAGEAPSSINLINPDGTGLTLLLNLEDAWIRDVTWSADGQWLAFTSNLAGNLDIYLLKIDSGTLFNITSESLQPEWGPGFLP